jgi:hypothetical protein
VGSQTIREKYKEKLKRLRKEGKAIAVISFMIFDTDFKNQVLSEEEKENISQKLAEQFNFKSE